MKIFFTLCIVCVFVCSQAQSTFVKTYGGLNDDDVYSVKQTFDGGYIMVGSTESFGTSKSIYLIKTNSSGDTLWTKTFEGDYEFGESIQQTSDSGYIISGMAQDSLSNSNVYLIKTDNNGNILWRKCYDGDEGFSVFQNDDHGYIICGTTYVGFYTDISLIRTDSSGDPIWKEGITLNIGGSYYGYSVQQTNDGGFIVAGLGNIGYYLAFLLKVDRNGALTWSKTLYSATSDYLVQYVQQTNDGGYILAGNADGFPLLIKTNSLGNVVWSKQYLSVSFTYAPVFSVYQSNDSGYVVACSNWSNSKSYPFLIKTDSSGTVLWAREYSSCKSSPSAHSSVRQTLDGGYIMSCPVDSFGAGLKDFCLIKTNTIGGSGCSDSTIAISDTTISTLTTPISPNVYTTAVGILPNESIGSGGMITTICLNANSISNIGQDSKLLKVFPNPLSNTATISFSLSKSQNGSLKIFNVRGQLISILADKNYKEGENEVVWNSFEMSAGIYFLQFQSAENIQMEKLIITR